MSIISGNSSTPSRRSSSKLIREGSIISRPISQAGEMNTDEYIAKMEEMDELLSNLEEKMNSVEMKLGEVDEILDNHEQKHNQMIAFEKKIVKEKLALKKLEEQHVELNV
ncbi:uncharacterized protein LOC120352635 isoform X1 [Nilaparvata lugens]|nr:uncharacterized protein LOC120352635 isoform X1 [Nilaparvata lugens]XP_039289960.1 uncharacterized protein LOC120352635 isoform X1 [Nilaparvata lugens]XP_039289961.1 uncharacterized protein LOC120352635 isoform X1 [Nilaparvata lugens]XP_039289962.1 uncharacterized protein LOC120352635 isoform X1 [Nilaparvata lugens]